MSTAEKYDSAGGPAFPAPDSCEHGGMTLRDYFAGQALPLIMKVLFEPPLAGQLGDDIITAGVAAKKSYLFADAMLRTRSPQDTHHD